MDTRLPQPSGIALRRFMLPHPHIHCRHSHNRLVSREDQGCRQIVCNSGCHFSHKIRRCGAHNHQISLAAQLDMTHFSFVL